MRLHVEWGRPVMLKNAKSDGMVYVLDLERVPVTAGVYVFGRRWGKQFEALYVGKANNIRSRAKTHLNNLRLMSHLRDAKSGKRVLLAGTLVTKGGQKLAKSLAVAEKAFIRHFLSEGHDLVNRQGTRLRRHEVASSGRYPKRYFPREIHLEKAKGG